MGLIGCFEMLVTNYNCMLPNIPQERRSHMMMQALVWLCMVHFRATWFGTVQFGTSYTYLRWLHIF